MNSFAIWYNSDKDGAIETDNEVELHFNLWKLKKRNTTFVKFNKKKKSNMFLDIGIKLNNINHIDNIKIFIPFKKINIDDIEDLGIRMKDNRKLINGIFNDDCEIRHNCSEDGFTVKRKNEEIKIHTLDYEYQKNLSIEVISEGCIIAIKTSEDKSSNEEKAYYRFRISGKSINEFGRNLKSRDNILKTYSESNHIIDFRVNEKRALPENLNMLLQKNNQFKIKTIHFLLLMDINYKLACTGLDYTMRALEDKLWEEYLDDKYETGCLVGYHWKESNDNGIENFNSLIRIKDIESNFITIGIYIIGVIVLSIISSIISSVLYDYWVN
ncbi:hypothetical protein P5F16_01120 [Clostridium perfringens]|nr:hypothetical protein [Clostridium perfringens]